MSVGSAGDNAATGISGAGEHATPQHRATTPRAASTASGGRGPLSDADAHGAVADSAGSPGETREPLLVRPFLLQDGEPGEGTASAATWPADPSREIPTQVIPAVPATTPAPTKRSRGRRRPLLLAGAGAAAVLAVVGWAVIRPALEPTVSASLPGQQLPAITGPAPTTSSATNGDAAAGGDADTSGNGPDDDAGAAPPATTPSRTVSASATATAGPTAAPRPTTQPSAGATTTAPGPPVEFAPSPLENSPKPLISGQGLCLDLRGGDVVEGADVHIDDCNGSSPQQWLLNDDRTLAVKDLCAVMEGSGTVELARCDGRTTAQWSLNDDGRLMNAANGRCLADPSFGARPGSPVIVTFCAGTPNQHWTFR